MENPSYEETKDGAINQRKKEERQTERKEKHFKKTTQQEHLNYWAYTDEQGWFNFGKQEL